MQRYDQRVDPAEAEEVVRLAAERHAATVNDGPTVGGLAEALGLPESEVERLLADVRNRRAPVSDRRFGDRSAAISAAIVLALFLVVAVVGGGFMMLRRQETAREGIHISGPDGESVHIGPGGVIVDGTRVDQTMPPAVPGPPEVIESPAVDVSKEAEAAAREAIESLRQDLASGPSQEETSAKKQALEELIRHFKDQYGKAP